MNIRMGTLLWQGVTVGQITEVENRHTGERLRLERVSSNGGEDTILIEGSIPAGGQGPPLHNHPRSLERFTVISGFMGVQVGRETEVLEVGESAIIEAGIAHTWWNAGEEEVVVHGEMAPAADLDHFMEAITKAMNRTRTGRPPIFDAAVILDRYPDASKPETVPKPVQAVLLPVALGVARILGRHHRYGIS